MTTPKTKDAQPKHGTIRCFYAVCWDAHLKEWLLVPCSRADLLRQVVVLP